MVNDILYLDSRKLILNPYDYQPSRDEIIGLQRLFYSRFGIDLTISLENPLVYEPFENEQHFLVYCKISDKDFNTQKQAMIEKLQRMENLSIMGIIFL